MSGDARTMIAQAARDAVEQVPALAPLKLVVDVELQGRGDLQLFRLQMPEIEVTRVMEPASDARLRVEMRRDDFNTLVEQGSVKAWKKAFQEGKVKVSGVDQYMKLIVQVVEKQMSRDQLKKARH